LVKLINTGERPAGGNWVRWLAKHSGYALLYATLVQYLACSPSKRMHQELTLVQVYGNGARGQGDGLGQQYL
jgi:hypothetical protein